MARYYIYLQCMAADHSRMLENTTLAVEKGLIIININLELDLAPFLTRESIHMSKNVYLFWYSNIQFISPCLVQSIAKLLKHCPGVNPASMPLNWEIYFQQNTTLEKFKTHTTKSVLRTRFYKMLYGLEKTI